MHFSKEWQELPDLSILQAAFMLAGRDPFFYTPLFLRSPETFEQDFPEIQDIFEYCEDLIFDASRGKLNVSEETEVGSAVTTRITRKSFCVWCRESGFENLANWLCPLPTQNELSSPANTESGASNDLTTEQDTPPTNSAPPIPNHNPKMPTRGVSSLILEHWEALTQLHPQGPTGRQAERALKRILGPDAPKVVTKTYQNAIVRLRKDKLIP